MKKWARPIITQGEVVHVGEWVDITDKPTWSPVSFLDDLITGDLYPVQPGDIAFVEMPLRSGQKVWINIQRIDYVQATHCVSMEKPE